MMFLALELIDGGDGGRFEKTYEILYAPQDEGQTAETIELDVAGALEKTVGGQRDEAAGGQLGLAPAGLKAELTDSMGDLGAGSFC
jgi:hypothetical protein